MTKEKTSLFNPGDIEYYVARYIRENEQLFRNKVCIDAPAGQGVTSRVLLEVGADVAAFDLFPEYFKLDKVTCKKADLTKNIPLEDNHADWFICQEGFEHISDQLAVFKEINRVLKPGGNLLVTVPNYSNLKSKLGFLFFETECYGRDMPPNELDTVWHADNNKKAKDIYFGHAFLSGIQKLMFLAKMNGFSLKESNRTKINKTSLFFFPFLYPLIAFVSFRTYVYACKKKHKAGATGFKEIYKPLLKINLNPKTLVCKNLFLKFQKVGSFEETKKSLFTGKELSPWETISSNQKNY
ncbi:MAG: class I SAM-dependent methyltransferase [Pseudomonadota bacterium]